MGQCLSISTPGSSWVYKPPSYMYTPRIPTSYPPRASTDRRGCPAESTHLHLHGPQMYYRQQYDSLPFQTHVQLDLECFYLPLSSPRWPTALVYIADRSIGFTAKSLTAPCLSRIPCLVPRNGETIGRGEWTWV